MNSNEMDNFDQTGVITRRRRKNTGSNSPNQTQNGLPTHSSHNVSSSPHSQKYFQHHSRNGTYDDTNENPMMSGEPVTHASVLHALLWVTSYHCQWLLKNIYQKAPKIMFITLKIVLVLFAIFILLVSIAFFKFVRYEIVPVCTPPSILDPGDLTSLDSSQPPLVEYYVHGRGNGHYARSVAVVEELLQNGIDVRMFVSRAVLWKAVNQGQKIGKGKNSTNVNDNAPLKVKEGKQRGHLTVQSITSLMPTMGILETISHIIERVAANCEVSKATNRYPAVVVSDGDAPGYLRALAGAIPSIVVSHGLTFFVAKPPDYILNDKVLKKEWAKQRTLTTFGSGGQFSQYQIGTNFVNIEARKKNAIIAISPMRTEVLDMAAERKSRSRFANQVEEGQSSILGSYDNILSQSGSTGKLNGRIAVKESFIKPLEATKIGNHLLGNDIQSSLSTFKAGVENKMIQPLSISEPKLERRKLIVCYFRDKNGDALTNALLRSGFDILLFEKGYQSTTRPKNKWLVQRNEDSKQKDEESLEEYWRNILAENRSGKLLDNEVTPKSKEEDYILEDREKNNENSSLSKERKRRLKWSVQRNEDSEKKDEESLEEYWGNILAENRSGTLLNNEVTQKSKEEDYILEDREKNHENSSLSKERKRRLKKTQNKSLPTDEENSQLDTASEVLSSLVQGNPLAPPRIIRVSDMSLFVPLLGVADAVASSSGSQLATECFHANLPLVAIYLEGDGEQRMNAEFLIHRSHETDSVDDTTEEQTKRILRGKQRNKSEGDVKDETSQPSTEKRPKNMHVAFSIESFQRVFSSNLDDNTDASKDGMSENGKLLSLEEESNLQSESERKTYTAFNEFVDATRSSMNSWSYYHDLFQGVFISKNGDSLVTPMDYTGDDEDVHDPFQGMPVASDVILGIIEDRLEKGYAKGFFDNLIEALYTSNKK